VAEGMIIKGFRWGNSRKRDHFENLGVEERIILKWICKTSVEMAWIRKSRLNYKDKWQAVWTRICSLRLLTARVMFDELLKENFAHWC